MMKEVTSYAFYTDKPYKVIYNDVTGCLIIEHEDFGNITIDKVTLEYILKGINWK